MKKLDKKNKNNRNWFNHNTWRLKTKRIISSMFTVAMIIAPLLSNYVLAQGLTSKGIKVGLNFANVTGDTVEGELESKTGFALGGFIVLGITDNLGIRPEVLYSMKGYKSELDFLETTVKSKFNLSYLEIPVLLQYTLPMEGSFKPNVFIGPALGIKLSAKDKVEEGPVGEEERDIENIRSTDFGLVLGAGAVLNDKITFDVRYNLGLTSIFDIPDFDVKNQLISIMLGFSL